MGEIVNLRQMRKLRARADAEKQAVENRRRSGLRKQDRTMERTLREKAERTLEGHRRENGGDAKS